MTTKDEAVQAVFDQLNLVFSGEKPFDEALMELNFHTAQVRKTWPAFYSVLASFNGNPGIGITIAEAWVTAQKVNTIVERPPEKKLEPVVMNYGEWAKTIGKMSHLEEEQFQFMWNLAPEVPRYGVGEVLTLSNGQARFRWKVLAVQDEMMTVCQVAVLAPGT